MPDLSNLFRAFGLEPTSSDPYVLSVVAVHILLGMTCVVAGIGAMVSQKQKGRHPMFGSIYFWGISALFASATLLAMRHWAENYHLFLLGALSFGGAWLGRTVYRQRWRGWMRLHIISMGFSYIFMLTAFYVDNGPKLPFWKELPTLTLWLLPGVIGIPFIVLGLLRRRLVQLSGRCL